MKRVLITLASSALVLAATPAIASAAPRSHVCHVSIGYVTASGNTSCAFANNIMNAYNAGRCSHHAICVGRVYSPVTNKTYRVTAYTSSDGAYVTTSGNNAWLSWSWN
jgi:hypothetical protein